MADNGFNGLTATWNPEGDNTAATLGTITNLSDEGTAAEIDVTGSSDSTHVFESGLPDSTTTVDLAGVPANESDDSTNIAVGDKGALAVTWPDAGTEGTLSGTAAITGLSISGSVDQPITSSLTFRPSVAT